MEYKWHSTRYELPSSSNGKAYIVYCWGSLSVALAGYNPGTKHFYCWKDDDYYPLNDVLYWIEVPDIPEDLPPLQENEAAYWINKFEEPKVNEYEID